MPNDSWRLKRQKTSLHDQKLGRIRSYVGSKNRSLVGQDASRQSRCGLGLQKARCEIWKRQI